MRLERCLVGVAQHDVAERDEDLSSEGLGENVCLLLARVDFGGVDEPVGEPLANRVILDSDVFALGCDAFVSDHEDGGGVVHVDDRGRRLWVTEAGEEPSIPEYLLARLDCCDVLGFRRAERHVVLLLRCPMVDGGEEVAEYALGADDGFCGRRCLIAGDLDD